MVMVPVMVMKLCIIMAKLLLKGFADGIHIVGKTAHQLPMGMGVKVGQGRRWVCRNRSERISLTTFWEIWTII